ncbi:hypothetical protein CNYM01_11734 [Colletotrichum nymphaeae SA-01]|uniref:Uncharacterized protein n=1 Tax=Colletotrichum nymphaeae SA-01 TaxID=1460502 RepID=A0A135UTB0_9PEZI|nr:hypothetical protein CNYM01_11734 [Colletotrichum nymphaeae SA-01]
MLAPRPSLFRELYSALSQIGCSESTVSDFAVRQVTQNGPQGEQPRPPANPQYHSTPYTTPYTLVQDSSATDTSNLENSILLVCKFPCKLLYKKKLIIPPFLAPVIPSPSPSSSHFTHTTLNSTFSHNHPNFPPPPTQNLTQQKTAKMRAVFAIISLLAATVAARFDGPCTDTICGDSKVNCEAEGRICVGFPSVDPEKRLGCTCSIV